MAENMGRELGWNDTIENDSSLLPDGDYRFEVKALGRGRYNPGPQSKMPACNKAVLTIEVSGDDNFGTITHNFFLHSSVEWRLCEFFTAIGHRKSGEPLVMNWNKVVGAKGMCKVGTRKWSGNDGAERESNDIKKFYDPADMPAPATATPAASKSYKAGAF